MMKILKIIFILFIFPISWCRAEGISTADEEYCTIKDFKMAFILVVKEGSELTKERSTKLNNIKNTLPSYFMKATKGLAQIDTSYEIINLIDDGTLIQNDRIILYNVAKKFYEKNNDQFHFISVYTSFPTNVPQYHQIVKNEIENIGLGIYNDTSYYGSKKLLMGINHMGFIDMYHDPTNEPMGVLGLNGIMHETGHQWCCYIGQNFDPNNISSMPILNNGSHFYRGLNTFDIGGDNMGANYWISNGDGTYRLASEPYQGQTYHPFILYYMGLLDKTEVAENFPLYNAGIYPNYSDYTATWVRNITIEDLINENGERGCVLPTKIGWNVFERPVFAEEKLATNCFLYSFNRRGFWEGRAVSYGLPINDSTDIFKFYISCY